MAKGKKTGGRDWKPGCPSPGPGRPAVSPIIKEVQQLNQVELVKILNEIIHLDKEELAALEAEPKTNMFKLIIISILKQAKAKGDQQRINFVLDRLVGKPKEQIEHSGEGFRIVIEDYLSKKKND